MYGFKDDIALPPVLDPAGKYGNTNSRPLAPQAVTPTDDPNPIAGVAPGAPMIDDPNPLIGVEPQGVDIDAPNEPRNGAPPKVNDYDDPQD